MSNLNIPCCIPKNSPLTGSHSLPVPSFFSSSFGTTLQNADAFSLFSLLIFAPTLSLQELLGENHEPS